MTSFIPFQSIESFDHVVRKVHRYPHLAPNTVAYRGKIKLHGTNAGIKICSDSTFVAQSRNRVLSIGSDNAGFAFWAETHKDYFMYIKEDENDLVIFGEWCGGNIQTGVALSEIKEKFFAVFEVVRIYPDGSVQVYYEPSMIASILKNPATDLLYILPWQTEAKYVNFNDVYSCEKFAEFCNEVVLETEECDPWVKETFGVSGVGEGLVFYPVSQYSEPYENLTSDIMFKAKGGKHRGTKVDKAVKSGITIVEGAQEFADLVITVARCEQALHEIGGIRSPENTGKFLKWISNDILKECVPELLEAGLEWKQVSPKVIANAKAWWISPQT